MPKPCWNTRVANPNAAPTVRRFIRIDVSAIDEAAEHDEQQQERDDEDEADRVRGASGEHRGEVAVLRGGAADLRASAPRSSSSARSVLTSVAVRGVVDGGRTGDAHDDAAGRRRRGDDACVDDAGLGRRRSVTTCWRVGGGGGDERGCGGAGTERRRRACRSRRGWCCPCRRPARRACRGACRARGR